MSGPKTTTQKSDTTSKSTTGPSAAAAGYFPPLYQQGGEAVTSNQGLPAPQDFVAPADPHQREALDMIYGAAPSLGSNAPALSDMAHKVASGYFLDPTNDPTFAGAASAAISPITRQLRENILPSLVDRSIRSGGTGSGPSAYGGVSLDLSEGKALQDWEQRAGDITSSMANASRGMGMNLIPQAPALAAGANNIALAPATATGAAGTQERGFAQDALTNLLQRYSMNQQAPWSGLQQFANLLTTGGFKDSTGTGTQIGETTTPAPDMMTQILQGITGTAGIAGSLFGAPMGGASAISGLGSILGGLGGGGSNPTLYPTNPWSTAGIFGGKMIGA